jgi:hypothetical protein
MHFNSLKNYYIFKKFQKFVHIEYFKAFHLTKELLPFQPSLMFAGKAGAYSSEAPFRCSTLGYPLASPTNKRLGWKGLLGTNTLAYYENL